MAAVNIDDPPAEAYRTLSDVAYGPGLRRQFVGHTTSVNAVTISPDGRYVRSGSGRIAFHLENPEDNSVRLWDIETGEEILRFDEHTDSVTDVAFTSDGKKAVSASWDGSVIVWDIENPGTETTNRQLVSFEGHRGHVGEIAISPDDRYVLREAFQTPDDQDARGMEAENTSGIELILWDIQTGEEIRRFDFEHAERFAMDGPWISPDGNSALVSIIDFVGNTPAERQRLILFSLATGEVIQTIDELAYWSSFAMSFDGRTAITDTRVMADISEVPGALLLWDLASGKLIRSIGRLDDTHESEISGMTFSPDGHTVLSSSYDGTLILWDVDSGQFLQRLVGHTPILAVAFTPDGQSAVSAELDGALRL